MPKLKLAKLIKLWSVSATLLSCFLSFSVFSSGASAQTIEHSSGLCFRTQNNSSSPSNGTKVVLNNNCAGAAAEFSWSPGGSIKHVPSNKCIHPGGSANPMNGTELVLWDGCDFADRVRFNRTGAGSIQQASSGKCVHPNGGSPNPSNDTALVMWNGCNEQRLAFNINAGSFNPITPPPVNTGGVRNRSQLVSAIRNANNGDVISLGASFSSQQAVTITKPVIIEGNGNTINHSVPASGAFSEFTPAFVVAANNVIIRNLTINGNNRFGSNTLVELNNQGNTRSNNFTLFNVTLQNASAGLRNRGIIPSNLRITNNTFRNMSKAIDLTRDAAISNFTRQRTNFFDTAGDRIFYQNAGSLTISSNRFFVDPGQVAMQVGIQIDAGNDGFNPDPAPGFPDNSFANRGNFNDLVTKFNGGVIANNTGQAASDPLRATEFPIALAKVADVTIRDNFVETVGSTSDIFDFSSGINVEHMSRDVTIRNNAIAVNRVVSGDQNNQGISVLPFQDHGSNASSEEATVGVRILDNQFYGAGRSGVFGLAFRNLEIDGNNFNQYSSARPGLATINLFNTDDNGNGSLQNNERSTLSGSFVNFGASTNLAASGLVDATLFDTSDPSDLPPDLR